MTWKHARELEQINKLIEAQKTGYLDADAPHDVYYDIPEEPDRKWTDKPSKRREAEHA